MEMAHFAVICPEGAGHLLSVGELGNELARRGHRVTLLGSSRAALMAEKLGLPLHPWSTDDVPWPSAWLRRSVFGLAGASWAIDWQCWFGWRNEVLLRLLPTTLEDLQVDGLVTDQILLAAGTVAEHLNIPFVTVCSALPWNQEDGVPPPHTDWEFAPGRRARWQNRLGYAARNWLVRPVLKRINRYRQGWNLPPVKHVDETYSSLAQLCQLCPEMDFLRREMPGVFHYVGPLGAFRPADDIEFPWARLNGRPLIFASMGTVARARGFNFPVLQRILAACTDLDAQLVMTRGKWAKQDEQGTREALGPVPGDTILVDFAPQLALLDRADLLITHAGINTVMEALAREVPMVALPQGADQPGMAARVQYAGVGLKGSFQKSTPEQIRRMIKRVLAEETFRTQATQMKQAIANAGGVQRAAEIAERALTTGQPVHREERVDA
ncbi:glycosyltransferase [Thermodesulfobacteriota bacterium]